MPRARKPDGCFYQLTITARVGDSTKRLVQHFTDKGAAAEAGFRAIRAGYGVEESVFKLYADADDAENDMRFWFS